HEIAGRRDIVGGPDPRYTVALGQYIVPVGFGDSDPRLAFSRQKEGPRVSRLDEQAVFRPLESDREPFSRQLDPVELRGIRVESKQAGAWGIHRVVLGSQEIDAPLQGLHEPDAAHGLTRPTRSILLGCGPGRRNPEERGVPAYVEPEPVTSAERVGDEVERDHRHSISRPPDFEGFRPQLHESYAIAEPQPDGQSSADDPGAVQRPR